MEAGLARLARQPGKEGDIGIYGMAVLAYFSHGILVFSLKNCGITILEILRYTVFAILDSKLRLLTKFACGITVLNTPQCPTNALLGKRDLAV